jgi:seryl-tRNA synthetase
MSITARVHLEGSQAADGGVRSLFHPMGIDGIYARSALYERVVEGLSALISRYRVPDTEVLRFPPVMSRRQLEKAGYMQSFPHLMGCVSCLNGDEAEISNLMQLFEAGGEWTSGLSLADVVLTPAACYPLYPLVASRGHVPAGGLLFDVACDCFRREPSKDLARLQSFRMREYVCVGAAQQVTEFRNQWISRAQGLADRLGLACRIEQASDPFFGRGGKLMASSQKEQSLKFELLIPRHSAQPPTACMSFNYHRDHFGTTWDLRSARGDLAHTSCVAFGIDRLAIALFSAHGTNLEQWPAQAREALMLEKQNM